MNWLERTSQKSLIDEIGSWGWSEDQLEMDAVQIYRKGNDFFVSIGDWAKIEMDDMIGSIKRVYPGAEVDWDYESGRGDDWERIF